MACAGCQKARQQLVQGAKEKDIVKVKTAIINGVKVLLRVK